MAQGYDIVIIGAGPGGYVAALRAVQLGAKVAVVEGDRVGGTCLNRGCIPVKAMMADAHLYQKLASGEFGIASEGRFSVDFGRLVSRRRGVVEGLVSGVERLLESRSVDVLTGRGSIVRPGLVSVGRPRGAYEIEGRAIIVATGAEPAIAPIPGTDLPGVVTSDGLLATDALPESLVVIGGSTVGTEFACIYGALGSRVAILEKYSFLREADATLAKRLRAVLKRRGISVRTEIDVLQIEPGQGGDLRVCYIERGSEKSIDAEAVLMATGRRPYVEGLGLDRLGVAMRGGGIAVDSHMQTSVPGIYAVGDCTGSHMLAHVASYEGVVAVESIMGYSREADYSVVPYSVYAMPEIAGVGLTEEAAVGSGLDVRVSSFPLRVNGRALTLGEPEGQVRMICQANEDGRGGRLLGVHILGTSASDLIAEAAVAMRMGATAEDIAHTMHQHPTLSEALAEAAMAQLDGAIHFGRR